MSEAHDTRLERIGDGSRKYYGLYRCSCPAKTVKEIYDYSVRDGVTRSCGCLLRTGMGRKYGKKWESASPEYRAWDGMMGRCYRPKYVQFADYGGRGIRVCDKWRASYKEFLADMGRKPSPRHSLDRIDVNGDYEPGNVRWATVVEQHRNTRRTQMITYGGKTQCVADWVKELPMGRVFKTRLDRGWSVQDAFERPVAHKRVKRK